MQNYNLMLISWALADICTLLSGILVIRGGKTEKGCLQDLSDIYSPVAILGENSMKNNNHE